MSASSAAVPTRPGSSGLSVKLNPHSKPFQPLKEKPPSHQAVTHSAKRPPSIWEFTAKLRKCVFSTSVQDLADVCHVLHNILHFAKPDIITALVAPWSQDLWERMCLHIITTTPEHLADVVKFLIRARHAHADTLLVRLWSVPDIVKTLTKTPGKDVSWVSPWLDVVCLDASGKLLPTAINRHKDVLHLSTIAAAEAGLSPPRVQTFLDRQLLIHYLEGSKDPVQCAPHRWKYWFGDASLSMLEAPTVGITVLFCQALQPCAAAFFEEGNFLKCLKLCAAATTSSSSSCSTSATVAQTTDTAYLLAWCKHVLRLFVDDAAMQAEVSALPHPVSLFSMFVRVFAEQLLHVDGIVPVHSRGTTAIPWLGYAVAHIRARSVYEKTHWSSAYISSDITRDMNTKLDGFIAAQLTLLRAAASSPSPSPSPSMTTGSSLVPSPTTTSGTAAEEWTLRKSKGYVSNSIEKVMQLVGLENVKHTFVRMKDFIVLQQARGLDVRLDPFHVRFVGNHGCGKTLVARLYAEFLQENRVVIGHGLLDKDAQSMVDAGAAEGFIKPVQNMLSNSGGGIVIIDRAGSLDPLANSVGRSIVSDVLQRLENNVGSFAFVFCGGAKELDLLFGHSTHLANRVLERFVFEDFNEKQLMQLIKHLLHARDRRFMVDGEFDGLAVRIVARRLAAQRGPDFGNAHAVQNQINIMLRRQAQRLQKQKLSAAVSAAPFTSDQYFHLTFADVVGPNPLTALEDSASYKQLMGMIGLKQVKREIQQIIHAVRENYERELRGQEKANIPLHRAFVGSPGVGKTTVVELYGKILCDLGILSKGEFHLRGASDFIGAALGESEKKTNALLATCKGSVLAIDEAYSLDPGRSNDPYRKAVLDALVEKVQPTGDDDRVVLLLGYKEPIEMMMRNANPGLARRFDWSNPIVFEDFTEDELLQILSDYLRKKAIPCSLAGIFTAMDVLSKKRRLPNFGNAGEVHNVVNSAVSRYMARTRENKASPRELMPEDFLSTQEQVIESLDDIFRPMLGCQTIVKRLRTMSTLIERKKAKGQDYMTSLNLNFCLVGPPGTGKSSVAALLGRVFHSLGILASSEVVSISASKLQGEFVGQTAPRVRNMFKSALGKVLFIDESYRLDPKQTHGSFMKEAMDEMVNILTEAEFKGKLVVVLAGYTREMHQMLSANEGLASRFPEEIAFPMFTIDDSLQLLTTLLQTKQYTVESELTSDRKLRAVMAEITSMAGFASGRTVHTLAERIDMDLASREKDITNVTISDVVDVLEVYLAEQHVRVRNSHSSNGNNSSHDHIPSSFASNCEHMTAPIIKIDLKKEFKVDRPSSAGTTSSDDSDSDAEDPSEEDEKASDVPHRDPGVSAEAWSQLQMRVKFQQQQQRDTHRRKRQLAKTIGDLEGQLREALLDGDSESIRAIQAALELARSEEHKIRNGERKIFDVQKRIREMGICPEGYAWTRNGNGWICRGGGHKISDEELARGR